MGTGGPVAICPWRILKIGLLERRELALLLREERESTERLGIVTTRGEERLLDERELLERERREGTTMGSDGSIQVGASEERTGGLRDSVRFGLRGPKRSLSGSPTTVGACRSNDKMGACGEIWIGASNWGRSGWGRVGRGLVARSAWITGSTLSEFDT
jgi:hypothetical protein